ncbi:helix-turn-helix domain-containing protein [Haloarcula sp. S1AR25-5A]|uniref:Helix-turn-helix domain-containing protein n=1 Tax=Haloarcula terrestris TaxID=2950533 RepID=A0AAE4JLA0_9EURY|nr:helix-turn-helix domain-containing protein [Haloarcula terrestris]MDS0223821.1 helix-turn-helix domain-containing protein [Haloarcula terrestris]
MENPVEEFDELHWKIVDVLREGRATPSYLSQRTGESRQLVSQRLRDLRLSGFVEKVHKGLYELVEDPRQGSREVPHEMISAVNAIEWEGQGGAKTDERVRALASAVALLKERGESAPVVLRRHINNEFDLELKDSSVQRLLSDNLPKIPQVETESSGQIYVWNEENE